MPDSKEKSGEETMHRIGRDDIDAKQYDSGQKAVKQGPEEKAGENSHGRIRRIAYAGAECYPFVRTGGLGDVLFALPRAMAEKACEVRVILPCYACIPPVYLQKMSLCGEFMMDLCLDGRTFYVGVMEYSMDGITYYFIDNKDYFGWGSPYTDAVRDIPKYCLFAKAVLAALNYLGWIPDVIHCHDWQTALIPVYLKTLFAGTPVGKAKTLLTIHNLKYQGIYNISTIQYWTGLPGYAFRFSAMKQGEEDANILKGGIAYADMITTVSESYAEDIQTISGGEGLDAHLRYHAQKMHAVENGVMEERWSSERDPFLPVRYTAGNRKEGKKAAKRALQEAFGLEADEDKMVLAMVACFKDPKEIGLVQDILRRINDEAIQSVVMDTEYGRLEELLRNGGETADSGLYALKPYDERVFHLLHAGADLLLVPIFFEPDGMTQRIAAHYGTVSAACRSNAGNRCGEADGFAFEKYEAAEIAETVRKAEALFFRAPSDWETMEQRNAARDRSWSHAADQYRELYDQLEE